MTDYTHYNRTSLSSFLFVRSIVTVVQVELSHTLCGGESHPFPELVYVESGCHTLKVNGTPYTMEPGQMILYGPNAFHEGDQPSSAKLSIISFEADLPEGFPFYNQVITLTGKHQHSLFPILSEGLRVFLPVIKDSVLQGMVPQEDIPAYTLHRLRNRLELFLIDLYEDYGTAQPHPVASYQENYRAEQYSQMLSYMQSHLGETLTLSQIADGCAMSVSRLKLICKEQCGCGPITCFINMKIDAAKKLICDSSITLTQISQQLGFQSVHYFSRLFKEKTGVSPSAYAKSIDKG